MRKLGLIVVALCLVAGSISAFGAASEQGCSSSGNQAAGCGGAGGNGGNGGNGGSGGTGGSGGNANNAVTNTNTNTANGGSVGNITNTANGGSASAVNSATGGSSTGTASSTSSASNGSQTVNVGGTTIKTHAYSFGSAATSAAAGTDSVNVGTFLGGVGFSRTSAFAKTDVYINRLIEAYKAGVLTKEEFEPKYTSALKRLEKQSKKNDRTLFGDLFGILY